jgi:hypothetical protein
MNRIFPANPKDARANPAECAAISKGSGNRQITITKISQAVRLLSTTHKRKKLDRPYGMIQFL